MLAIFIGIFAGMTIALQTAINARLRGFLQAPFLTALTSFFIGTVTLLLLLLLNGQALMPSATLLTNTPWWAWFGGVLGMIGLTGNVLLFPKLGGVQTAVMPILGQVLMGCLLDSFGWLNSPQVDFGIQRALGIGLVLSGIFTTVILPNVKSLRAHHEKGLWGWRIAGVVIGTMMALQTAVNGELGRQAHSTTYAALISMLGGVTCISIIVLSVERRFRTLLLAVGKGKPAWIWLGGVLGAFYISVGAHLMQHIGTGGTVVLMLCGLIAMSLIIDKWGLLGVPKKTIQPVQIIGLLLLISGVAIIRL